MQLALDVIRCCSRLPQKPEYWVIGRQLMRSASSVGANYRSARRAQSAPAFIARMAIVEEEADETQYWLELLVRLGAPDMDELRRLADEAGQVAAIAVASKKTARGNLKHK